MGAGGGGRGQGGGQGRGRMGGPLGSWGDRDLPMPEMRAAGDA